MRDRTGGGPSSSTVERFRLTGPTRSYDPRITAVRRDIADVTLAARLFAPHYARAELAMCRRDPVMLCDAADGRAVSQLLPGERFAVLDISGDWAWGYSQHDGYVGYVRKSALTAPAPDPTHIVRHRIAPIFEQADIKAPVSAFLPVGSRLTGPSEGAFLRLADGGYVHHRHVAAITDHSADAAAIASDLVGLPYLWGGRGGGGIDCSGLVQQALARACGLAVPRDSDQQRAAIGDAVPADAALARNDIVFFPGHVGIMIDAATIVHANAHWMSVTIEPLDAVVARLAADTPDPILARRRLP